MKFAIYMNGQISFTLLLMIFSVSFVKSQETDCEQTHSLFFIEQGVKTGLIVPNYSNYPESSLLSSFHLKIGKFPYNTENVWATYNNYPLVGAKLSFTQLGNSQVLGNEFRLMPFIEYNTKSKLPKAISFMIALGASYVSKYYDKVYNPTNKYLGSRINWAFELFLNYNLYATKNGLLRLEGGYAHSSNGHFQIPNAGLNYASVGLSYLFFTSAPSAIHFQEFTKPETKRKRQYFIQYRNGVGLHELGGSFSPVGGEKGNVFESSLSLGILNNQTIKYYTGFSYRFYEHFYELFSPEDNDSDGSLSHSNLVWKASNVYYFIGVEFIYGHLGFNMEGGLNLYKPFYKLYNETYIKNSGFKYFLKRSFNSRMGLKLYLKNANRMPKNNLFLGINISANFSQADFSDICVGYIRSVF